MRPHAGSLHILLSRKRIFLRWLYLPAESFPEKEQLHSNTGCLLTRLLLAALIHSFSGDLEGLEGPLQSPEHVAHLPEGVFPPQTQSWANISDSSGFLTLCVCCYM